MSDALMLSIDFTTFLLKAILCIAGMIFSIKKFNEDSIFKVLFSGFFILLVVYTCHIFVGLFSDLVISLGKNVYYFTFTVNFLDFVGVFLIFIWITKYYKKKTQV